VQTKRPYPPGRNDTSRTPFSVRSAGSASVALSPGAPSRSRQAGWWCSAISRWRYRRCARALGKPLASPSGGKQYACPSMIILAPRERSGELDLDEDTKAAGPPRHGRTELLGVLEAVQGYDRVGVAEEPRQARRLGGAHDLVGDQDVSDARRGHDLGF